MNVVGALKINELVDLIFLRKDTSNPDFMFKNPALEVIGNTDV
jgi:hypothetical protein